MSTSEQNMDNGPQGSPTPVPWQRRPWVWAVLGALLVLIGYLIGSCFREPGPDLTADASREELESIALANEKIQAEVAGKDLVKVIVVANKLVNIVTK